MASSWLNRLALATALLGVAQALAQTSVETVTVTGRALEAAPPVSGFGAEPLARSPFGASSFAAGTLQAAGARQLADLTRLDAGLGDAYNAEGYWSLLSVRGFTLDNRFNYRRDGLPINAETAISLDNKQRVDVLKGTSGIQAGTSAPGGLVDLIVKRPDRDLQSVQLEARQGGTVGIALDLSRRFGADEAVGLRLNAAHEHLDPPSFDAKGQRGLLALAVDGRIGADALLEAEIEWSRQSQPSVPGLSLLGDVVPSAKSIDPRINLNDQPWSQPVVLRGTTASLRWQQRLAQGWRFTAHGMTQRLESDDRIAFPFGCSAESRFDRYCSDGSFDLYDFRSDDERRRNDALDLSVTGQAEGGRIGHALTTGVLFTRFESRFGRQAFNFTGTGDITGTILTPAAPEATAEQTDRVERSTELYLRDTARLSDAWRLWAGVRHTRLHRRGAQTDGAQATAYDQSALLPWIALGHQWSPNTLLYASWGQGLESDVAPARAAYTNAGQALPALKSRQLEAGVKFEDDGLTASLAVFGIVRPQTSDIGPCTSTAATCTRQLDGSARHRGLEAATAWRIGAWRLQGSALWLDARRRGSADHALDGLRPPNVPRSNLRLQADHDLAALPGAALTFAIQHDGNRMALPDNSARIASWTRVDLAASYVQQLADTRLSWRLALDNALDNRAWRESPYQFAHAYLFPLPPRTLWMSVSMQR